MGIMWNESMSTGIPKIDTQHKKLIDTMNALGEAMQVGKGKAEIEKTLIFAGEYAQEHFRDEEKFFDRYQCPDAKQNKEGHTYFIKRFTDLTTEFQTQGASFVLVMKIYNELSTWLIRHILGVDVKLRSFVKKQ